MRLDSSIATPANGVASWKALFTLLTANGWVETWSAGSGITAGVNLSWSLLIAPDGRQWTFQRGTDNRTARIKYSRVAGFTGGLPSATRTPSATDEVVLAGGGTDAFPMGQFCWPTDGSYSTYMSCTKDRYGSGLAGGWGFWLGIALTAGPAVRGAFCFEPIMEGSFVECDDFAAPTSGDADPWIIRCVGAASAPSDPAPWQLNTTTSLGWANATYANNSVNAWHKPGLAGALFANWTGGSWYGNVSNLDRAQGNIEVNPYNSKYQAADISIYRTNLSGGAAAGSRVMKGLLAYSKALLTGGPAFLAAFDHTAQVAQVKFNTTASNVGAVTLPWPGGVAPADVGSDLEYLACRSPADQDIPSINSFSPVSSTALTAAQPVTVSVYYGRKNVRISADFATEEELIYDTDGGARPGYAVVVTVVDDRETTYQITPDVEWKGATIDLNVLAQNQFNDAAGVATYTAPGVSPGDAVDPVVTVISTSPIKRYDPWIVDVTDDQALAIVLISVTLRDLGTPPEVAFDGVAFTSQYSPGSTKVAISGGFRFTLHRADGWISSPSFSVLAVDTGGNLAA